MLTKNAFDGKITLDNAHKDQSDLLNDCIDFRGTKPRNIEKKKLKRDPIESINKVHYMKVEKWFLMILKVEYFHYNQLKVQVIQVC